MDQQFERFRLGKEAYSKESIISNYLKVAMSGGTNIKEDVEMNFIYSHAIDNTIISRDLYC